MVALLKEAEAALNTDRKLAESYAKAGNVLLPMLFTIGSPRGKPDKPLPDFVLKNAIPAQGSDELGAAARPRRCRCRSTAWAAPRRASAT